MKIAALLILGIALLPPPAGAETDFSSHWHDGLAELDGYRLTVSRYGAEREGRAVMIYVTEPFSEEKKVKVDNPSANRSDTFDALKLNLVRDFQTGIYDYNTMVSLFVRSDDFSPAKTTYSSAEWCGHIYEERLFGNGKILSTLSSYMENQSGEKRVKYPSKSITEDNLFILLRGLRGPFLLAGEKESFAFLPGTYAGHLMQSPFEWTTATIERRKKREEIDVPAGNFIVDVYDINIADGRTGQFLVEEAYPHRIVRWELLPDVRGELTGSKRLAYWQLNDPGGRSYLADLGLETAGD